MRDPIRLASDPGNALEATLLRAGRARAPLAARQKAVAGATAAIAVGGLTAGTAGAAVAKGAIAGTHWLAIAGFVGVGAVATAVVMRSEEPTRVATVATATANPRATAIAAATASPTATTTATSTTTA